MRQQTRILALSLLALAAIFISCDRRTVYTSALSLPSEGWHADSTLCFDFCLSDLEAAYDVVIFFRHKENYPYQNVWLIVDQKPISTASSDTIEFYLADQRGRWLSGGIGKTKQMPVLYLHDHHFADSCYTMSIRHAMRDQTLQGVSDIGLRITKSRQ